MAVFGSTINPALGRVDYSPLAQGLAMGGQLAAQGLSNFGQGVTQGVQNFLKKQEEKRNEEEGLAFIKNQIPGIDDAAAKAGLKAAGGAAAFVKFKSDMAAQADADRMRRLQLSEMERQANERLRLEQFLSQTPAGEAIAGGASFENLPSGAAAFAPRQFASSAELISAGQRAGVPLTSILPVARGMADISKTQAETATLLTGKPKAGFATPEAAVSKANEIIGERKGLVGSFTTFQGQYLPKVEQVPLAPYESEEQKLQAQRASRRMDEVEKNIANAFAAADSAALVLNALNAGETTGVFTPITTFVSRALNLEGAAQKTLLAKGIAGLSAQQITSLARGLGSMSNADRDYFATTAPTITDPTQSNRFYAEIAMLNQQFAQEDQDYISSRRADKVETDQILSELEKRRAKRNVAKDVYARVIGGISSNAGQYLK